MNEPDLERMPGPDSEHHVHDEIDQGYVEDGENLTELAGDDSDDDGLFGGWLPRWW